MHTALSDIYEIDAPIFAFSHSPAVIAAVSKAGGFGVLGLLAWNPSNSIRRCKCLTGSAR